MAVPATANVSRALTGVYRSPIAVDHNPVPSQDLPNNTSSSTNRTNYRFSKWSSVHHTNTSTAAIRERSIENVSTCYTSETNDAIDEPPH
eukprot:gene13054-27547_t